MQKMLSGMPSKVPIVSSETFQVFGAPGGDRRRRGKGKGKGKRKRKGGGLGAGMNGLNLFDFARADAKKKKEGQEKKKEGLLLDISLKRRPEASYHHCLPTDIDQRLISHVGFRSFPI